MTAKYRFCIEYADLMNCSEIKLNVTPFRYLEKGKVTEYFPINVRVDVKTGSIEMLGGCLAVRREYDRNYDWVFQDNKMHPLPYEDLVEMAKQMTTAIEDWLFSEWAKSRDSYRPIEELIRTLQSQDLS